MIIVKSEQEIKDFAEGKGSENCALTAFRQGKPVLICTPDDDIKEVTEIVKKTMGDE